MPSGQQTTNDWVQRILQQVQALLDEGGAINVDAAGRLLQTIPSDIRAQLFGGGGGLEAPSPQAQAISQADLDIALAKAEADMQAYGIETAAQNFVNQISQAQETRKTAEFAQDYARNLAPPGMTTLPGTGPQSGRAQLFGQVGWEAPPAIPFSPGPAAGPYQALGQAQQAVPQAPELQFNAPALPGRVDLGQYSPFPQTGTELPLTTGQDMSAYARMLAEAMRRVIGPDTALFGPMQLPMPGGR